MMSNQFDRISQDIVWAIQEGVAASYSELHSILRVYPATSVASAVNSLLDRGALSLGTSGFEILSMKGQNADREAVPAPAQEEKPEMPLPELSDSVLSPGAEEEAEKGNVVATDGSTVEGVLTGELFDPDEGEVGAKEAEIGVRKAEIDEADELPRLLEESTGSILTLTPISFLGLPDHLLRDLSSQGIGAVYQLVERLSQLGSVIGKDRLAVVLKRLADLAGDPPVKLSTDDRRQLSILSGSNLIYFDWFGVMCSNIPSELDKHEIFERLADKSYNVHYDEPFSFAEFRSDFQQNSIAADQKLFETFKRKGYPVNGDAFHVIMLPTVEDMLDEGAYDDPNELAHDCLKTFVDRRTTENACFGLLRDKFLALKEKTDGVGSSERIQVGGDECFSRAARRLEELESCCVFDEEALTLQCLSDSAAKQRNIW